MNIKTIFATSLLILIVVGLLGYGYLVYSINNDVTNNSGKLIVSGHKMLFYSQLVIQLLQFVVAGFIVYKA